MGRADELREPAEYFDEVPTVKPQKDMFPRIIVKTSAFYHPFKRVAAIPNQPVGRRILVVRVPSVLDPL